MPAERLTPDQRSLHARLAAHASWAKTDDPSARTAPARKAALDRFELEVDPDGVLQPAERARRAEHARKAYFLKLALKSARARRKGAAPPGGTALGRNARPGGSTSASSKLHEGRGAA